MGSSSGVRLPVDVEAVGILPWNTCNARCAHCMPESGPKDRTALRDEDVFKIIHEAAQCYEDGWILALSGGEPFLHHERLLSYVRLASEHGARTSVVTNGFWATSEAVASDLLVPFVDAGLGLLTLSVSSYHTAYVSPDRVTNAVLAARGVGLDVGFKALVSKSSTLRRIFGAVRRTEPIPERLLSLLSSADISGGTRHALEKRPRRKLLSMCSAGESFRLYRPACNEIRLQN